MHMEVLLGIHGVCDVVDPGSEDAKKNNIVKGLLSQSILEDLILQVDKFENQEGNVGSINTRNLRADRMKEERLQTLITKFENLKMSDIGFDFTIGKFENQEGNVGSINTRNLRVDRVKGERLQTLITKFKNLKMSDNGTIDEYAAKLSGISSHSATLGEVTSEHKPVKKFLTSFPRRFVHFVETLEKVLDLKETGFEDVVRKLKAYEERVKEEDKANEKRNCFMLRLKNPTRIVTQIEEEDVVHTLEVMVEGMVKDVVGETIKTKTQLKVRKPYCLQANVDEESWLGHVRLGHIGFGAVNLMHKLARGVPVTKHQRASMWYMGIYVDRYFSFGRHLDELHVTWAHLEKKWMRLRTNTKTLKDLCSQSLETASQAIHDAVTTHLIDRSKLDQFVQFRFSSLTEEEGWNRIKEYVQYQDDLWDEPSPSMNISSIAEAMQPTLKGRLKRACKQISFLKTPTQEVGLKNPYLIYDYCGGSHEADECKLNNPPEQVCLFGGDIYNDPSLLRFYQKDDTSPCGNSKRKEKGEDGPE
ncbi:hypothetical protein Tco_0421002 [Tanacetum coccineum]